MRTQLSALLAIALACTFFAAPANAQAIRTFVSVAGSDSNPCTIIQPCRHFSAAVAATAVGGEVDALDPGAYGSFTISHAITIEGQGWSYVAPPANGEAITVNAVSGNVNIRGVSLNGVGVTNATGIQFNSGGSLTVRDSVIRNFSGSGIALAPSTSARIAVSNTLVANNGVHGIYLQPSGSGTVSAVFNRVEAYSNGQEGIGIFGNSLSTGGVVEATAVDSVAGFNNDGFYALGSPSAFNTFLYVFRSATLRNVRNGIRGEQFAIVHVSSSNLEADAWGQSSGGCVASFGDNIIDQAAPCGTVIGKN